MGGEGRKIGWKMAEARTRAGEGRGPGQERGLLIAIDGPTASGKTTVGQAVARRLGYYFLDTGSMYRALTWLALRRGLDPDDAGALAALARTVHMRLGPAPPGSANASSILVEGEDATPHLRRPEVERAVSLVSRVPAVREEMVRLQRELAREGGVVVAGRDIGTVVLPGAQVKVFLTASLEERARRRYRELRAQGWRGSLEQVKRDVQRRDEIDSTREVSPLRPAPDAIVLDTEGLSIEQVVEQVVQLAQKRGS